MKTKPNFKKGDEIRIVNYGHKIWIHKNEKVSKNLKVIESPDDSEIINYDLRPELVGLRFNINNVEKFENTFHYSLIDFDTGSKISRFAEDQLEHVLIDKDELIELGFKIINNDWHLDITLYITMTLIISDGYYYPGLIEKSEMSYENIQMISLNRFKRLHSLKTLINTLKYKEG